MSSLFKDEHGDPLILTPGQQQIFRSIEKRKHPRNQAITPTRYGKSLTVALAVIIRAITMPEKWAIVAPTMDKARIIMDYVIQHLFDSPLFLSQLDIDFSIERLKRERSKERLTFKRGGEIRTFTADAKHIANVQKALMGFGAPNVIEDESALIEDNLHATVMRMLGDSKDNFLFKIGNPFQRNHFYRTWQTEKYNKIFVNYEQGIAEGRFTGEYIEEMREEAFFSVLYEGKFPEEDEMDERGYRNLILNSELNNSYVEKVALGGGNDNRYLGCDIGGGGDWNAFVIRDPGGALLVGKNRAKDTMSNVGEIQRIMSEYDIKPYNVFIDDTGIGHGVTDRLKELKLLVNGVILGEKAYDATKYVNIKAEAFWALRIWIKRGGKIQRHDDFNQLSVIKYKVDSDKRLKIESKDDLRRRGVRSPDIADALMLTFGNQEPVARVTRL
jgi:hypothetical protein